MDARMHIQVYDETPPIVPYIKLSWAKHSVAYDFVAVGQPHSSSQLYMHQKQLILGSKQSDVLSIYLKASG